MSRQQTSDPIADLVGNILLTGVLAAGAVAVVAGIAIAESFHTPTEEKLRRLAPQETWGALITEMPCPHCRAHTEAQAGHCYICGNLL